MMKFDPTKVNANLPHQNTIFMSEMRPISSKHIRFSYATNSLSRLDFICFVHYATMKIGICRKVIALGTTPRSIISVFIHSVGLQITARHLTSYCTGQNVILFNPKYRVAHLQKEAVMLPQRCQKDYRGRFDRCFVPSQIFFIHFLLHLKRGFLEAITTSPKILVILL